MTIFGPYVTTGTTFVSGVAELDGIFLVPVVVTTVDEDFVDVVVLVATVLGFEWW